MHVLLEVHELLESPSGPSTPAVRLSMPLLPAVTAATAPLSHEAAYELQLALPPAYYHRCSLLSQAGLHAKRSPLLHGPHS